MEVGSGGVDHEVLLLYKFNAQDGLVPGQSPEDIHTTPDLPSLEVQGAIEPSDDLDVVACWRRRDGAHGLEALPPRPNGLEGSGTSPPRCRISLILCPPGRSCPILPVCR